MTDIKFRKFRYIDDQLSDIVQRINRDKLKEISVEKNHIIDCEHSNFFDDEYIKKLNGILELPSEGIQAIYYALNIIRTNREIRALLCDFLNIDFTLQQDKSEEVFEYYNAPTSGIFQVLFVMFALQKTLNMYEKLDVPYDIIKNSLSDINIWIGNYQNKNDGKWGLSNLAWVYLTLSTQMFRIGSLQYLCKPFRYYTVFYRNIHDNSIAILSKSGEKFRRDGLLDGTNEIYDEGGGFITELKEDENYIYSNCLIKDGYAYKNDVKLSKKSWEAILYEGAESLEIHIPQRADISYKNCLDSLYNAYIFYKERFPDKTLRTFHCGSWLLEPQLQKILPPTSNIVAFQKFFYIFPLGGGENSFFNRVFGFVPDDIFEFVKTAQGNTSLQRAIIGHLSMGHRLHAAAGAILFNEIIKLKEN